MPFGMTTPEQYAWFYYGGGMDLMKKKAYAKHGVFHSQVETQEIKWVDGLEKEINTVADLQGLKRIPGFAGEVMAKLGLSVTNI